MDAHDTFVAAERAWNRGKRKEAVTLYKKAAAQGHAQAQHVLGWFYFHGDEGFRQDYAAAMKWYRRSAEQGNEGAQARLGGMYADGDVPEDFVLAHMWFILCDSTACVSTKLHYDPEHGIERTAECMTPAQIAEAEKLAREWKPKAAVSEILDAAD